MRLGLGTAQFGFNYGISNHTGKVPEQEVRKILDCAYQNSLRVIDTALGYGESEKILGKVLKPGHSFQIITKTRAFRKESITKEDARVLVDDFNASLDHLRLSSLYGLLFHHSEDLFAKNGRLLFDTVKKIKERGLVQKIGVSVYNADHLNYFINSFEFDLIQVPINVLDQRLALSRHLKELKKKNVEIHARSIFLQGLLLMDPEHLDDYFLPFRDAILKYHHFLRINNLSPIAGALNYIRHLAEIDCAVVGVCSAEELSIVLSEYKNAGIPRYDFSSYACFDERLINPLMWPVNQSTVEGKI